MLHEMHWRSSISASSMTHTLYTGLACAGRACMSLAWCARPAALCPGLPWAPGLRALWPPRGVLGSRRPLCALEPRLPFSPPISGLHHHSTAQQHSLGIEPLAAHTLSSPPGS